MSSHSAKEKKGAAANATQTKKKKQNDGKPNELPSTVAQLYYKHGLFLTSYPTCATSLSIMVVLFCCYPLMNIPFPGTIPTKVVLPYSVISGDGVTSIPYQDAQKNVDNINSLSNDLIENSSDKSTDGMVTGDPTLLHQSTTKTSKKSFLNIDTNHLYRLYTNLTSTTSSMLIADPPFPWAHRIDPYIYVQQILLKSVVLPWHKKLQLTDAFRGPLFEVFKLLEIINNHEDANKVTLSNLCLHVENVKRPNKQAAVFPEYNCLLLSPANLWRQNVHNFNKDPSLLDTIFSHHNFQKSKVSIAEMLFGIQMSDTGIKRYPMRIRPRTIQYAITLMMREKNLEYLSSLEKKLYSLYPLHQKQSMDENTGSNFEKKSVTYVYYPGEFNAAEFVPLLMAYVMLFLYVYFSIRKVDMIKSRFILAASSVVTVIGSLVMSLGLCFFFGLAINVQSKGVYPYLVILVGLENCLVLTKAVMTTDNNLDVKIRVAQGLSKEGWSITKNILTEITILTVGLATFVPIIQEFCIFAIVGLLSDYFLQMLFFSTVLGLNVKRVEFMKEVKLQLHSNATTDSRMYSINRSKSHPSKLDTADMTVKTAEKKKIPKRLRVVNFWARTRIFQRGFMIWMVLWISNIIYNSGIIEHAFLTATGDQKIKNSDRPTHESNSDYENMIKNLTNIMTDFRASTSFQTGGAAAKSTSDSFDLSDMLQRIKHMDYEINQKLSNFHWSSILKQYNMSLSGRYITILPSIKLSHIVPYEMVLKIRNPNEKPPSTSKWSALAVALDPLEFSDLNEEQPPMSLGDRPLYPKTPMEILLTSILCFVSIIVITYTMVVMYRCICSRNYAEWRSSWNDTERVETKSDLRILEGYPIQVNGHTHHIECIVTDGNLIASSCLQGQLKIWDSTNGDLVAEIDRVNYFEKMRQFYSDRQLISGSSECIRNPIISKRSADSGSSQLRLRNLIKFDFQMQNSSQVDREPVIATSPKSPSSIIDDFHASYEKYFSSGSDPMLEQSSPNTNKTTLQRSNSMHNESLDKQHSYLSSPIWSLDFVDNLIVIGCGDGRLEFWEGTTGNFKCIYETESSRNNGVTNIKLSGDRVIVARLSGCIEFLHLETYTQGRQIDWNFTSAYRRTHVRTGSAGSISGIFNQQKELQRHSLQSTHNLASQTSPIASPTPILPGGSNQDLQQPFNSSNNEELRCILESQQQGHQQPITCLDVFENIVFSGSQDHTLKVYRIGTNSLSFTLHGHCGPITTLFIDKYQRNSGCSASQDGLLCVWDLDSGACIYSLQAHDDSIVSMASAPSYIISLGLDETLRVWERFQGHLLNTINVGYPYSNLLMLTPSLLVTGKPGALLVWDVRTGEPAHEVKLDGSNRQLCPKIMLPSYGSVICDYGNQLRIVRFPLVTSDKCE